MPAWKTKTCAFRSLYARGQAERSSMWPLGSNSIKKVEKEEEIRTIQRLHGPSAPSTSASKVDSRSENTLYKPDIQCVFVRTPPCDASCVFCTNPKS